MHCEEEGAGGGEGGITVQHFHNFIVMSLRSSSTQDTREEGQEVSAAGRKKGAFIWEEEGGRGYGEPQV